MGKADIGKADEGVGRAAGGVVVERAAESDTRGLLGDGGWTPVPFCRSNRNEQRRSRTIGPTRGKLRNPTCRTIVVVGVCGRRASILQTDIFHPGYRTSMAPTAVTVV